MDSLQRPLLWYLSFITGTPETPATSARKRVATELLDAVRDHHYDSQTLEEIIIVIDHECLCRELEISRSSGEIFQSTIATSAIGEFAHQLSSCLVQYVDPFSHVLRELQCRALLSVLALLQLRGVTAQDPDSHNRLQNQINSLFRNLVWSPGESTAITPEAFRRAQCSHLLSLVAAQPFVSAEPRSARLLKIATDVLQLGVLAVNIALV
jgi:AcrR family transcriptional regulator